MKNMQRLGLKILLLTIALSGPAKVSAQGRSAEAELKTADSLFVAKRFVQSFEHYQRVLEQKKYSPAMLLKMAFIQEGLNNIGQSMYYLNLYFRITHDSGTLDKMDNLASKYNLEGYDRTDTDWFSTFYHEHHTQISLALAALVVFMFAVIIRSRITYKRRPVASFSVCLLLLIGLFVHLNFGERGAQGIVTNARTYIMNGPSAAASVVEIVSGGHRVEVIGKKDIWLKIRWDGEVAYVRDNSLMPIAL